MQHNHKIAVFLVVAVGTAILLWGTRAVPSMFSFWPDK